ncbi:Uncharacterized protein DIS24_g10874 [Lasiodiplodia hormozganensis]|uniref:Splicing factor 3B subunit 10 n=1 Tax=Lasiodiplodia hormozganensis TaxID=869390 RepID=A0AA39X6U1_9PEZI|nr:Uncharacterized protein DIS24_g10874 [Lasiodiplodia hormozganensis]
MADKLRTQQQLEQLQARYVGTGHADTSPFEFKTNYMRDYRSSVVGHPELLQHTAIGMGVSRERIRLAQIEAMIQAAGRAPQRGQTRSDKYYEEQQAERAKKMAAKWAEDFGQKDKFTSMKFFSQGPDTEAPEDKGSKQLVREDVNMEEGQDGKGQE